MAEKFYMKDNVYEAALKRIEFLLNEFDDFVVGFSGGKDSTVVLNLTIEVAKKLNKLPVKVLFLDQEAEWQSTIEYVRQTMSRPEIEPMWLQIPFKIYNATSTQEPWLQCWEPGKDSEWIRPKEDISIKENKYGTDRFADMFTKVFEVEFKDRSCCYLAGVRTEESPTRMMALTEQPTYKWITYGKYLNKKLGHYTFYPIYDWSYTDVWKAIHDNHWDYCKIYDYMYQYGVPTQDMRVSNIHHETAVKSLYYLQEIEGETWNKVVKRISGINTAGQIKADAFVVDRLPHMFDTWPEYRDYLLDNLITEPDQKNKFKREFAKWDQTFHNPIIIEAANRACITAILKNDYHMTTMGNFWRNPLVNTYRKYKEGKEQFAKNKNIYLEAEYGQAIYQS